MTRTRRPMYLDSLALDALKRARTLAKPGKPFSKEAIIREMMTDDIFTQGIDKMAAVSAFLIPQRVYVNEAKRCVNDLPRRRDTHGLRRCVCLTIPGKGQQWYFPRLLTKAHLRRLMEMKEQGATEYLGARRKLERLYKQMELLPDNAIVDSVYDRAFPESPAQQSDVA